MTQTAAKNAYTAAFSDGRSKHIAGSKRVYLAAWQVILSKAGQEDFAIMGFSATRGMADMAWRREVSWHLKHGATLVRHEIIDVSPLAS